ncbi:MAG: fibronectin type III domain-containing protein, partial [Actinomycetota bacterium]|nr:fibronectin type III domain-containing protein [Actinomycetota bacterium]
MSGPRILLAALVAALLANLLPAAALAVPPDAPTSVIGTVVGPQSLTFDWDAPAGGDPVVDYVVTLTPGGVTATVVDSIATFENLVQGTTYEASVVARDLEEESSSPGVSAPILLALVPDAPVVSAVGSSSSSVSVSWSAPAANGSTITGYQVSLSPGGQAATTAAGDLNHVFSGLSASTQYTVSVVATSNNGPGGAGTATATTSAPDPGPPVVIPVIPGAPAGVVAAATAPFARSVVVSWVAPANTGGSPLTGFVVTLGGLALRPGAGQTSATFSAVAPGSHQPSVGATNAVGPGPVATGAAVEVRAFAPYNSEVAFVTQQYWDFLGRGPDGAGLAHREGVTRADGTNVDSVILSFMRSPEFSPRRAISRLYLAYFNRRPDKAGLDFWTAELAN